MTAGREESLIYAPASYTEPLPLVEMFGAAGPLEVELGAGDGSFLVAYARAHPEVHFLGVERLLGRLRKIDKKGRRAGLKNLRLVRLEAGYLTRYLLAHGSVSAFHVYFPDPWPKRRHWKHRLINPEFAQAIGRALRPGGRVYLRTDDAHYFEQMRRSFESHPFFREVPTPPELLAFTTDFERDFLAKGIEARHAAYERAP